MVNGRGVQSIDVGGRILHALVKAGRPLMLRELSTMAEIAPAQAHAYLISFRRLEIVEQDEATGKYLLGPFAMHLGLGRMRAFSPLKLANKVVARLAEETGLRAFVGVWGTHGPVALQIEDGEEDLHLDLRPGKHHSLIKTATGKVFAAFMPWTIIAPQLEIEISEWGRRQYMNDAPTMPEVVAQIEATRSRGWGATKNDPTPGISTISAPVFDHTRQLQFTLTLVGSSRRLNSSEGSKDVTQLSHFAASVSEELGYQSGLQSDLGAAVAQDGERTTE